MEKIIMSSLIALILIGIVSIMVFVLCIRTMLSIIGIRKELHIKNLYTRRTLINYPYNIQLSELELEVYDFLYLRSPEWIDEKKIGSGLRVSYEKTFFDALDSLEKKGLIIESDGFYSVKFKNEQ